MQIKCVPITRPVIQLGTWLGNATGIVARVGTMGDRCGRRDSTKGCCTGGGGGEGIGTTNQEVR